MQVPKVFSCGQWTSLPPLDGRPDYPRKRRVCTASVSDSGSGTLSLDASLGRVYIVHTYQLEGQAPRGRDLHWVEKGRKVETPISWTFD